MVEQIGDDEPPIREDAEPRRVDLRRRRRLDVSDRRRRREQLLRDRAVVGIDRDPVLVELDRLPDAVGSPVREGL
ncbi:hypothetical protein ACEYYH_10460 [Microbacterium trichothecenolyticum]|uniref:hypothetical protein n=1 Tax=Microbacterium trichothecenolyticum TaxID=69370 RepID=UPI0035BE1DA9